MTLLLQILKPTQHLHYRWLQTFSRRHLWPVSVHFVCPLFDFNSPWGHHVSIIKVFATCVAEKLARIKIVQNAGCCFFGRVLSQFQERGYRQSIWQWWKSIVPFISNFYQFLLRASGVPTSQSKVREGVRKCVTVETCTVYPMISRTVNEGVASLWLVLSQIEQIMNEGVWLFDFPGASLSRKRK